MSNQSRKTQKQNLLAVLLEDYFHVGAFNQLIQRGQWYRFASRFEQNTLRTLDLLDENHTRATFFVLGWVAEQCPDLVKEVARRGHEIASRGYYNRSIHQMSPEEFREDLARTRETLERAADRRVLGYRAAHPWNQSADRWALQILAEEGYEYDTSIIPRNDEERFAHQLDFDGRKIQEFPVSTLNLPGFQLPISGGNYFRQFPHTIVRQAVAHWQKRTEAPFVMYFHVWELDPQQPRISGASPLARVRHYRNLDKMSWVLADYLREYYFDSFASYLNLDIRLNVAEPAAAFGRETIVISKGNVPASSEPADKQPVSIVIPCYNEELILPYLDNTLKSVTALLEQNYSPRFIFVDDCSTDDTWNSLNRIFGSRPNISIVRHLNNRGVAAAIMTGIEKADTEIVCSMDCDCTYDPHELANMIPLLDAQTDLVTASPYHAQGSVRNVPPWRLTLSRGASFLYRQVLNQNLATYTSCFRVYRRSAVTSLKLQEDGFLGVAELLGKLDLGGSKIVEYPATLEVRLFGRSKMKLLKTILGHLRLLMRLLVLRLTASGKQAGRLTAQHHSQNTFIADSAAQNLPAATKKELSKQL